MAGPSIVVRVLGDLKGLSGSFKDTGKQAETASSQIRGAFSSVLGTLNRTGVLGGLGDALAGIDDAIGRVIEHAKGIGPALTGTGAALVGVGGGLSAIGSKDQAAHQQLQAAVEATGGSYEDYAKRVEAAIKTQENYGHTAGETQDALTALTEATHDPAKALDLLATASNVAAAKHEDLRTAATQVGKVYNGNTKLLKEYGITIDKATGKTKDGQTAVQALADVTKGQAAASMDTFAGKLDVIKTKIEDTVAVFGQKWGPAIQAAGAGMTGLGAVITTTRGIMQTLGTTTVAAQETMVAATETEIVALEAEAGAAATADAASLPLIATIGLIVLAIAALGTIAYIIYRNWTTIWAGIKAAAKAVWDWIKNNWPYLTAILLGPIALAAAAIYKHWDTIKAGATDVKNWIVARWNDLVGFFVGLPGRITHIASGMWKGIANAFVDAINFIIHIWNGLQFKTPSIGFGPFHTPSITIGMPNIPNVPHMAQGGLVTSDGLIFAHAGEAITPLPSRLGPAVQIEGGITLNNEVDVDLFASRLAWVMQTRGV